MLDALRKRTDRETGEDGFTLIELMVVVLIIAILIAIAIPTFLGAQDRARDRAAQSNLRNGITAAKTIATDSEGKFYSSGTTEITATDLTAVEGAITFVEGSATDSGQVGVLTPQNDGTVIILNAKSASGKWFCMSAQSNGKVLYGKGDAVGNVDTLTGECDKAKF